MRLRAGLAENPKTGFSFRSDGQPVYFMTGDIVDDNERVYNVTVTDNAGLSSSLDVSTQGYKLSAAAAYDKMDTAYENPFDQDVTVQNKVDQNDDGTGTITIRALAKTAVSSKMPEAYDYDPSNATLHYEVYTNEACTSLFTSGRFRGLEGDVTVPGGTSWIKAFVRKPLYADSDVVTWQCRIVRKRIFVAPESMGGSDAGENDGSLGKPFATPQKALAAFQEGIDAHEYGADAAATSNVVLYMMLLGDIEASPSFAFATNENSFVNANLTGFDGTLRIEPREDKRVTLASVGENHRVMSVGGGKVVLNNIALTGGRAIGVAPQGGGLYVSGASSSVTLLNCEVSGNSAVDGAGVYCAAGTVSLDGSSVTGNSASSNGGGAYVEASASLKLNACQIKSNSSGVAGGGVCNQGTFSINGKNEITENTGSGGSSNVYLATGTLIEVSGSIAQSKIGVTLQGAAPRNRNPRGVHPRIQGERQHRKARKDFCLRRLACGYVQRGLNRSGVRAGRRRHLRRD